MIFNDKPIKFEGANVAGWFIATVREATTCELFRRTSANEATEQLKLYFKNHPLPWRNVDGNIVAANNVAVFLQEYGKMDSFRLNKILELANGYIGLIGETRNGQTL